MVKADFARWLNRALTYFERKEPSDATVDLWFEAVQDLPAEALPFAYQALTEMELWPRNLPSFMRAKAREWLQAHPRQPRGNCECHRGVWEVACWRPELDEWAIFSISCGNCNATNGPRQREDLLHPKLYDREPDRYMERPPPWGLIYPDSDSLEKKKAEVLAHLSRKRRRRPPETDSLEPEAGLPF